MLCYEMGTEIFKIKEEMTEKMKLKVSCQVEGSYGYFSKKGHFFRHSVYLIKY